MIDVVVVDGAELVAAEAALALDAAAEAHGHVEPHRDPAVRLDGDDDAAGARRRADARAGDDARVARRPLLRRAAALRRGRRRGCRRGCRAALPAAPRRRRRSGAGTASTTERKRSGVAQIKPSSS